ncbi:MAG: NADH-quinone oxidoreductase subunit M [Thermoflexales bacterium]|nr:NADH-quinone oxidoreductase subunit M [Thermoflexales bacterium]
MANFPILTLIMVAPLIGAALILLLPKDKTDVIKVTAAAASFTSMLLSLVVFLSYDRLQGGFQFQEKTPWIPELGISYHLGVDGFAAPQLLLTGIVMFAAVLVSWRQEDRPREFFAFLLLLVAGVFGSFMALDLFLMLIFYELVLFPVYVLIAGWGSKRREYAAMKLTIYLFVGSLVAIIGILALYFQAGNTFNFFDLQSGVAKLPNTVELQRTWFLPVFVGFGVLASLWPLHNWSPDGYAAAPTAVSMLHGGVLKATGAYCALRFGVQLMPQGAQYWMPVVVFFAMGGLIYAALIAFRQTDLKYIIGFSSVSHLGLVLLGIAALNELGLNGAGLELFAGGVMTGLMFALVGMIYERSHLRDVTELSGLIRVMPLAGIAFIIGALTLMGMPGLPGFPAELQIFMGLWNASATPSLMFPGATNGWYAIVAVAGILSVVINAAWTLRVAQRVYFSEPQHPELLKLPGLDPLERVAIGLMCGVLIVVGVLPNTVMSVVQAGVQTIVRGLTTTG